MNEMSFVPCCGVNGGCPQMNPCANTMEPLCECVCVFRRELRSSEMPSVSLSEEAFSSSSGWHCSFLSTKPSKTVKIIFFFFSQTRDNQVVASALSEPCTEQVASQNQTLETIISVTT